MSTLKKLFRLLTSQQKKILFFLMIAMMIGMILETLSIGLIIPVFAILSNEEERAQNEYINTFFELLGNPPLETSVIIVMISMVVIYLLKNIFLGFLTWAQVRFASAIQVNLSQNLFSVYLNQPYTFHLQKNSAELVRNVLGEVSQIQAAVTQIMTLFTEIGVIAGVLALLISAEPVGSIIVFLLLSSVSFLSNKLTKRKIVSLGEKRMYHDGKTNQHLIQGLSGVKDVKVFGREKAFLKLFYKQQIIRAKLNRTYAIISSLPKLWLELLAIIGLATLVITMITQNKPIRDILPILSLFSVAAFRLMPSANKILNAIQGLNFTKASLNMVHDELSNFYYSLKEISKENLSFSEKIEIKNLTFYYPNVIYPALKNITIVIPVKQSIGIIGQSGSGKSTLVDVFLGLFEPQAGEILVDKANIFRSESTLKSWQRMIGYVPQSIYLTDDTLRNNIAFGIEDEFIDDLALKNAIRDAQLEEFINSLPDGMNTLVGERGIRLSGGQRQRIGIARALYHDPSIIVLDEATSALDNKTEDGVMESVKKLHNKTIIIVAHRLSTVQHCDIIFKLGNGSLIENGSPKDIL